jgi:hypothetical protein
MSAYSIGEEYLKQYSKIVGRRYIEADIKKHKWWDAFVAIENKFGYKSEFNAKKFIAANFEKYGKVFPYQLTTKKSWETYSQQLQLEDENIDIEKVLAEKVVYFLRVLKLYTNKGKSIKDFVVENWVKIKNNQYDLYVLVFSKTFLNKNGEEGIVSSLEIMAKRFAVSSYERIKKVIEKNLGEDYNE